jgi:hypothetical protein
MNTQDLKGILLAEHKRDIKLMLIGYGVIAAAGLVVLGLILWLFSRTGASVGSVVSGMADESVPAYVKVVFPLAILISIGYLVWNYKKLACRPQDIDELVKHLDNGTRVVSITDSKIYRIKIPLYFINYHTGAVQMFGITLEGGRKAYILPVPFGYTSEVKDLLNENS